MPLSFKDPSPSGARSVYGHPCIAPPYQLLTSFLSDLHLLLAAPQVHPREKWHRPPRGAQAWDRADGPRWPLPLWNEQVRAMGMEEGLELAPGAGGSCLTMELALSTGLTTTSSDCRLCSSRRSSRSGWLRPSPKWKVWLRVWGGLEWRGIWENPEGEINEQGWRKTFSFSIPAPPPNPKPRTNLKLWLL